MDLKYCSPYSGMFLGIGIWFHTLTTIWRENKDCLVVQIGTSLIYFLCLIMFKMQIGTKSHCLINLSTAAKCVCVWVGCFY